MQINKLDNATLYAVDTLRFDAPEFVEYTPVAGETLKTSYPYLFFITIQSDKDSSVGTAADFEIEFHVKSIEPPYHFVGSAGFYIVGILLAHSCSTL